jgi:hypothetical protein
LIYGKRVDEVHKRLCVKINAGERPVIIHASDLVMRFACWMSDTVATQQADEPAESRKALTHGTYIVMM